MTRKISLIIGLAVAALAVSVPAAFGQSQPARDAHERGVVPQIGVHSALSTYRDASQRGAVPQQSAVSTYRDAFQRGAQLKPESSLGPSVGTYRDAFERTRPVAGPTDVPTISSGRELEWPQIGIGFGVGIVLMLGLYLALKGTRTRPLAH